MINMFNPQNSKKDSNWTNDIPSHPKFGPYGFFELLP